MLCLALFALLCAVRCACLLCGLLACLGSSAPFCLALLCFTLICSACSALFYVPARSSALFCLLFFVLLALVCLFLTDACCLHVVAVTSVSEDARMRGHFSVESARCSWSAPRRASALKTVLWMLAREVVLLGLHRVLFWLHRARWWSRVSSLCLAVSFAFFLILLTLFPCSGCQ